MRVAKRSSPGSYRRMRIPNASPSPPNTWATTAPSGVLSFTMKVTHRQGASSPAAPDLPGGAEKSGRANAAAPDATGECLQRGLRATAICEIPRHFSEMEKEPCRSGIGPRQHVVEKMLCAVGERQGRRGGCECGRRGRAEGCRQRCVVVAPDRIGVAVLEHRGEIERDVEIARFIGQLVGGEASRGNLDLVLE